MENLQQQKKAEKIECEVISDLLPLYADGVCSEKSAEYVEAHIAQCPACTRELRQLQTGIGTAVPVEVDVERAVENVGKKIKKDKKRAVRRTAAVALVIFLVIGMVSLFRLPLWFSYLYCNLNTAQALSKSEVFSVSHSNAPNYSNALASVYIDKSLGAYTQKETPRCIFLNFADGKQLTFCYWDKIQVNNSTFREKYGNKIFSFLTGGQAFLFPVVEKGMQNLGVKEEMLEGLTDNQVYLRLVNSDQGAPKLFCTPKTYATQCAYYWLSSQVLPVCCNSYIVFEDDTLQCFGQTLNHEDGLLYSIGVQDKSREITTENGCTLMFEGFTEEEVREIFDSLVLK